MCTKLQIFVLETKVCWKIESESERVNENMELKLRTLKGNLDHQQEIIDNWKVSKKSPTRKYKPLNQKFRIF